MSIARELLTTLLSELGDDSAPVLQEPTYRELQARRKQNSRSRKATPVQTASPQPSALHSPVTPTPQDEAPLNPKERQQTTAPLAFNAMNARQGVVWAEILGAPRARNPWRAR